MSTSWSSSVSDVWGRKEDRGEGGREGGRREGGRRDKMGEEIRWEAREDGGGREEGWREGGRGDKMGSEEEERR